jgi:hypothetical protein
MAKFFKTMPWPLSYAIKGLYILSALCISGLLIYGALNIMGVFNQNAGKPETWGNLIFNVVLFCTMMGIMYKLANIGGFLSNNPKFQLLLNTVLFIPCALSYIPCILIILMHFLFYLLGICHVNDIVPAKPYEVKILFVSMLLLGAYFVWVGFLQHYIQAAYLTQGGRQLVNQPIPTHQLTNIISYQQLSKSDTFNYQYAMSFWVYIDAFTSKSTHIAPLLSYGDNPLVKYSSETNTLYITVKQDMGEDNNNNNNKRNTVKDSLHTIITREQEKINNQWLHDKNGIRDAIEQVKQMPSFGNNDIDADGNRIIYTHSDVQLQKWNHILLNCSGGTLDVFYNGSLVKSAIEVVPYMSLDMLTVGSDNGIRGHVANVMYFQQPIDYLTVNTMYSSLKSANPPVIPDNNTDIIQ